MGKTTVLKGGEKRGRGRPKKVAPEDDGKPLPGGQEHLPNMEPMPKNERVHRLALRVKEASKLWSKAADDHKSLKEALSDAMEEDGLDGYYHYGNVTVHLDKTRKLKVEVKDDKESK